MTDVVYVCTPPSTPGHTFLPTAPSDLAWPSSCRPVEFTDDVLAAAGGLPMSHMDKAFAAQFGETIERLRKVGVCGAW